MKKYEISKVPEELLKEEAEQDAIFSFNYNPKKGITNFCDYFNIDINSPSEVAQALRNTKGLVGIKIGYFLSYSENENILKEYYRSFDLKAPILTALRAVFTDALDLPKETDSIDYLIRVFGDVYYEENKDKYLSSEIPYYLSFAVILLNSDLNNPQQKKKSKMTETQFIQNIRTVITEDFITDHELNIIYHEIKEFPLIKRFFLSQVMDEEEPRFKGVLCRKKGWSPDKEKYYVLSYDCLYYFNMENNIDNQPLGMIQLHNVDVLIEDNKEKYFSIASNNGKDISFVKYDKSEAQLIKGKRIIHFKAKTKELRDSWILHIARSISVNNKQNK